MLVFVLLTLVKFMIIFLICRHLILLWMSLWAYCSVASWGHWKIKWRKCIRRILHCKNFDNIKRHFFMDDCIFLKTRSKIDVRQIKILNLHKSWNLDMPHCLFESYEFLFPRSCKSESITFKVKLTSLDMQRSVLVPFLFFTK